MPGRVSAQPANASESAKQRIVAAALSVLAERGSHETSVKEVARAAGVAPGLVHYYFASKGELLLAVVRETCRAYREEMDAVELPPGAVARTRALLEWSKLRGLERPDWYRLLVDLDALALRDEALAREVGVLKREVRGHVALLVEDAEAQLGTSLGPSADAIASVLVYAVDGLVLQRLIDPEFDLDGGFAALEAMLVSMIENAQKR